MLVNGVWMDNTTCPFCKFRHPPELTCSKAAHIAATNKPEDLRYSMSYIRKDECAYWWAGECNACTDKCRYSTEDAPDAFAAELSLALLLRRWAECTSPTFHRHLSEACLLAALENEENQ